MIATYFKLIDSLLQDFPIIVSYTLTKKIYNRKQGYIGGSITFENGHRLDFIEVKNVDADGKIKYRYQYMDAQQGLIFRYDNAPHHKHLRTFPHHKHAGGKTQERLEPTLHDVLIEIVQMNRR